MGGCTTKPRPPVGRSRDDDTRATAIFTRTNLPARLFPILRSSLHCLCICLCHCHCLCFFFIVFAFVFVIAFVFVFVFVFVICGQSLFLLEQTCLRDYSAFCAQGSPFLKSCLTYWHCPFVGVGGEGCKCLLLVNTPRKNQRNTLDIRIRCLSTKLPKTQSLPLFFFQCLSPKSGQRQC